MTDKGETTFRWRAQRADGATSHYFDVLLWPGYLAVVGDLGAMTWLRCWDMATWARQSVDDPRYFAEKVVAGETEKYDGDVVRSWVCEEDRMVKKGEYDDGRAKKWKAIRVDVLRAVDDGRHEVLRVLYESQYLDASDLPSFEDFTGRFLWIREAVRFWLKNLGDFRFPPEPAPARGG
jgi:hypothetical protein